MWLGLIRDGLGAHGVGTGWGPAGRAATLPQGKRLPGALNERQMQFGGERAAKQERRGRGQGHPSSGGAALGRGNFLEEKNPSLWEGNGRTSWQRLPR